MIKKSKRNTAEKYEVISQDTRLDIWYIIGSGTNEINLELIE